MAGSSSAITSLVQQSAPTGGNGESSRAGGSRDVIDLTGVESEEDSDDGSEHEDDLVHFAPRNEDIPNATIITAIKRSPVLFAYAVEFYAQGGDVDKRIKDESTLFASLRFRRARERGYNGSKGWELEGILGSGHLPYDLRPREVRAVIDKFAINWNRTVDTIQQHLLILDQFAALTFIQAAWSAGIWGVGVTDDKYKSFLRFIARQRITLNFGYLSDQDIVRVAEKHKRVIRAILEQED